MGALSEWWWRRAHRRKSKRVQKHARDELRLVTVLTKEAPTRFSGATSQGIVAAEVEVRYLGRTAEVLSPGPDRFTITLDDERLDGSIERLSTVLRRGDEALAELRSHGGRQEALDADQNYSFHQEGTFLFVDNELVGEYEPPYFLGPELVISLIRELPFYPLLLFAASESIPIESSVDTQGLRRVE